MLQALLARVREAHSAELEGEEVAEAGFTLIELMVVLLILAILMAIAIPTFLGVTGGANDRAAQSNITNAITEASAVYQSNNQSFSVTTGSLTTMLNSSAPEFSWTTGACSSTSTNCISVDPGNSGQTLIIADFSKTGYCWYALYSPSQSASTDFSGATFPTTLNTNTNGEGTFYAKSSSGSQTSCTASTAATGTWGDSYANAGTA